LGLFLQLVVNGVGLGAAYALLALGFSLVWSVTGIFHLAHGGVFVLSGYLIYFFAVQLGLPMVVALALAIVCAAALGLLIDLAIYQPLARRGARSMTLIIASLACLIFMLNGAALIWGTEARRFDDLEAVTGFMIGPAYMSGVEVATVVVGAVLFLLTVAFLHFTRLGRAMRAVADNRDMSAVVGVNVRRVNAAVFALGSALVVPAAYLLGLREGLNPYSGLFVMLIASASAIVGGVNSVAGAALGAMLLALAQNLGIWKLPSAWQESIAFGVLLVFLVVRPEGFFGARTTGKGV
jgi:branched-subunit amino acid ABC-type transport system permease component